MSNEEIASGHDQALWVMPETVFNTPVAITSDGYLPVISDPNFEQPQVIVDSKEKRMSYSRSRRIATGFEAGSFSFDFYSRVSGVAGVAPVGDVVLASLIGKKYVGAGFINYELAKPGDPVVSFNALLKDGPEVRLFTGCIATKGTNKVKAGTGDDGIVTDSISGFYIREYVAGTDALKTAIDGSVTPVTVIPLDRDNAWKSFDVGARIKVGSDDAAGLGHLITARDEVANTVTIATGVTTSQAIGAVVCGWTPAVVETGFLVQGRYGQAEVSIDGGTTAEMEIIEASVEIDNGIKALTSKNNTPYPSRVRRAKRNITVQITRFFTKEGVDLRNDSRNQVAHAIEIPAGNESGFRFRHIMANVENETPKNSGDEERLQAWTGHALCTSSDADEYGRLYD